MRSKPRRVLVLGEITWVSFLLLFYEWCRMREITELLRELRGFRKRQMTPDTGFFGYGAFYSFY